MTFTERRTWDFVPAEHLLEGVFDADECTRIIALHEGRRHMEAITEAGGESYRNTDVFWLKYDDGEYGWIYDRVGEISRKFNAEKFQFEIDSCTDLQLGRYSSDQHYDWHVDLGADGYSRRKLSIAIMLSDPAAFEGGALQFGGGRFVRTAKVGRGDAVFFPSWVRHRVTAVTAGERWTLVGWWLGPPFK